MRCRPGLAQGGTFPLFGFLAVLVAAPAARAVTITEVTSPGGISAWLVEDHSLPVVTVDVTFRGGAALDPDGKEGLATLAADLLDEGAGDLDATEFHREVEDLAASLTFGAGEDTMGASLHTVTANLAPALALLHLALTAPRFDAAAVERVRDQLIATLAYDERQPRTLANRIWDETMFAGHPYARPMRGTAAGISTISAADMHDFVRAHFARDGMLIGVVGDITPETLRLLLDRSFDDLPARQTTATIPDVTPRRSDAVLLARLAIPQSVVVFGQPGIERDDPDWYAALLVNYALGGGGFDSRLTREVREKRGLAYSVYTNLASYEHAGVIAGGVATENARVAQSIDLIRDEWKRMRDDGPTAQELADAKTYLTGSFPLNLDSTVRVAALLVALQRDHLGIDYLDKRDALIDAVTLDDARRVARRLLDPDALLFVVCGSPEHLAGAHEVALPAVDGPEPAPPARVQPASGPRGPDQAQ